MSKLNDILDYIVAAQSTLGLQIEGKALGTVKRKLPKSEEPVDGGYQVTISGSEQVDRVKRIAFGSRWQVLYRVEITLVTPNDRDQLFNLTDHATWREATRAAWQVPGSVVVDGVKRVEIVDAPFLNRSQLNAGYDYDQVVLEITTYESRT